MGGGDIRWRAKNPTGPLEDFGKCDRFWTASCIVVGFAAFLIDKDSTLFATDIALT